jgi:hypothetical protein
MTFDTGVTSTARHPTAWSQPGANYATVDNSLIYFEYSRRPPLDDGTPFA